MRAILLLLGVLVAVGTGAGTTANLKPPVIHEPFTALPCPAHPVSIVELEGCYEKKVLATDRKINNQVNTIFYTLRPSFRRTFARSEIYWFRYRQSSCSTQVSNTTGGSGQPVRSAACAAARNRTHLSDLAELRMKLREH